MLPTQAVKRYSPPLKGGLCLVMFFQRVQYGSRETGKKLCHREVW